MQPLVLEWVRKAEQDYGSMRHEFLRDDPNYDDVCFHAQQCIEKLLKAILTNSDIRFGKTHDLVELIGLLLSQKPEWESLMDDCGGLSEYAIMFRYPGETAGRDVAERAIERCERVRKALRQSLDLPGQLELTA